MMQRHPAPLVFLFPLLAPFAVGTLFASSVPALEPPLRGMTVSCPRAGAIWGSPDMAEAITELRSMGVDWVSIHPYAGIRRDGSMRIRPTAETGYLEDAVRIARDGGVELFWKPHLAYWGSFEWRGDIRFDDPAERRRFFDDYRTFIVDHARFAEAHGVRLLAVGVELEGTTAHEKEWREIVAAVREVYSGKITYAANWDRLAWVPFWDAVDYIGVQAYFPLSSEDDPSPEALRRGWEGPLGELRLLSEHWGKPVIFAEIGYDLSRSAAREPWQATREPDDGARDLRRRLIRLALEEIERQPFIHGMFWWKWMPGDGHYHDRRDRDFSMRDPEAIEVVRSVWGRPAPSVAVTGE